MIKKKTIEFTDSPAKVMDNPLGKSAVNDFYLSADMNCAESIVRAANKLYSLEIDEHALRTASGFGGGMGAGHLCGAVSGCIMAAGMLFVRVRAHENDVLQNITADFIERINNHFDSLLCSEIEKKYSTEDFGCSQVVYETAEFFWNLVSDNNDKRIR
ncbi:MAG: C-GCAxxG-C-C family protein [Bacteroidetes bacterium]|nr:C-GCAxxG-C-C family protein [Bacteroidota bacterium]